MLKNLSQALNCPISKIFQLAEQMEQSEKSAHHHPSIDLLFYQLSEESQQIIRTLMEQMIKESGKNQR